MMTRPLSPPRPATTPEFYRLLERALRHGGPPPVLPEDAVRSLEVIDAAQRSAAEGRLIGM
jgi:predicted dehydrogenase